MSERKTRVLIAKPGLEYHPVLPQALISYLPKVPLQATFVNYTFHSNG